MRGRLTALLVVALVAGVALPAAAARDLTGTLVSLGPASQSVYEVGDLVSVPYGVDAADGELFGITLRYADGYGGEAWIYAWRDGDEGLPSSVMDTVTSDWLPGAYELQSVSLNLRDSGIYYSRDGATIQWEEGGPDTEGTHSVDLSLADFSVLNDDADVTAPVLESFAVAGDGVKHFGDEVNVTYEATDASGIGYAYFVFRDPQGREHWAIDSPEWDETGEEIPLDGIATGEIDITWASGPAELVEAVVVDDSYGRIVSYYSPDGTTSTEPSGIEDPPNDLDFTGGALDVDNAEFDIEAPALTSIQRLSPDRVLQGERLQLAYAADDPHFQGLHVEYRRDTDRAGLWSDWHDVPAAGEVEDVLWDWIEPGTYEFEELLLHDSGTGFSWFDRRGTLTTYDELTDEFHYDSHEFDLTGLDFTIEPWPVAIEDARTGHEVFMAPELGKVRFDTVGAPHIQDGVEFTSTGDKSWAVRYADADFMIAGTFDESTGDYALFFRLGNRADVLSNAAGGAFPAGE